MINGTECKLMPSLLTTVLNDRTCPSLRLNMKLLLALYHTDHANWTCIYNCSRLAGSPLGCMWWIWKSGTEFQCSHCCSQCKLQVHSLLIHGIPRAHRICQPRAYRSKPQGNSTSQRLSRHTVDQDSTVGSPWQSVAVQRVIATENASNVSK